MYRNVEEKVSQMTADGIIKYKNKIARRYLLFIFCLLSLYVYFGVLEIPILYWITFLAIPFSLLFYLPIFAYINRGYQKILTDQLDLDRYQDIFERYSVYKSGRPGSKNKAQKAFYYHNIAYIHFLRGDFSKSLEALSEFDVTDFRGNKKQSTVFYYYLECLNKIFSRQPYDLETYSEKVTEQNFKIESQKVLAQMRLHTLEALDKIVTRQELSYYFEGGEPRHHLDAVMRAYCSGLNELNQGHTDRAKTFFDKIANENPDLFYVQEAKKYLKEMTNAR